MNWKGFFGSLTTIGGGVFVATALFGMFPAVWYVLSGTALCGLCWGILEISDPTPIGRDD